MEERNLHGTAMSAEEKLRIVEERVRKNRSFEEVEAEFGVSREDIRRLEAQLFARGVCAFGIQDQPLLAFVQSAIAVVLALTFGHAAKGLVGVLEHFTENPPWVFLCLSMVVLFVLVGFLATLNELHARGKHAYRRWTFLV